VERRTSGAVEQQTPLNLLCGGLSATTPHTSSSRHDYASPSKVKALGWLEGRVNAGTDTRGVNHAVPVVECATVPTSYWRRKGWCQSVPTRHPFVFQLGCMMRTLRSGCQHHGRGGRGRRRCVVRGEVTAAAAAAARGT